MSGWFIKIIGPITHKYSWLPVMSDQAGSTSSVISTPPHVVRRTAAPQPRPEAEATQERRLEGVGCRRLLEHGTHSSFWSFFTSYSVAMQKQVQL